MVRDCSRQSGVVATNTTNPLPFLLNPLLPFIFLLPCKVQFFETPCPPAPLLSLRAERVFLLLSFLSCLLQIFSPFRPSPPTDERLFEPSFLSRHGVRLGGVRGGGEKNCNPRTLLCLYCLIKSSLSFVRSSVGVRREERTGLSMWGEPDPKSHNYSPNQYWGSSFPAAKLRKRGGGRKEKWSKLISLSESRRLIPESVAKKGGERGDDV